MAEYNKSERDKKYNMWARNFPAYICLAFPLVIFLLYFMDQSPTGQERFSVWITKIIAWASAIFPALFFSLRVLIRDLSSLLVDNIFYNRYWPKKSMYRILITPGKIISKASCNRIIKHQKDTRQLDLDESGITKDERWKRVKDIVYDIKNKTREDNIVFEYNCFYGFYRNMIGAMIIAILMLSFINHFFDFIPQDILNYIPYLVYICLSLIVISIVFMYRNDYKYAKKMFIFYLTSIDK